MSPWLSGWQYRKSHTIIGSTVGAVTDYQVRIKVHYSSGTDGGEDVYLNGHCRTDFGDVRFTSDDGVTLLSYWIEEKVDASYAIIWVKVPSIPASPNATTIYIYYGNPSATSQSNGENTFLFFDDFSSGNLNKWDIISGAPDVYNDGGNYVARLDANEQIGKTATWGNYAVHYKIKWVSFGTYGARAGARIRYVDANNFYDAINQYRSGYSYNNAIRKCVAGTYTDLASALSPAVSTGVWYKQWVSAYGSSLKAMFLSGAQTLSATDGTFTSGGILFPSWDSGNQIYIDDVFVRDYVEPEPSHGAWGFEEKLPVSQDFPMYFIRSGKAQELINKIG